MIFCFGSNQLGRHGKGSALFAKMYHGAVQGIGEGLQGNSYALPTKIEPYILMTLEQVRDSVNRFIEFANSRSDLTFQVVKVGCNHAGFIEDEIIPLFKDAPSNCLLPGMWLKKSNPDMVRLIVAGSRDYEDKTLVYKMLDFYTSKIKDRQKNLTIVSGLARGPDSLAIDYAGEHGLNWKEFPADWDRYGKSAGYVRNYTMAWHSTNLVAFWNTKSPGTKNMIELAGREGLCSRVVLI